MTDLLQSLFEKNNIYNIFETNQDHLLIAPQVNTLVVVPQLPLEAFHLQQLSKITTACQLLPEQILIIDTTTKWNVLRQTDSIQHILLFGVPEERFGVNIQLPLHQVISFDRKSWIKTLTIDALEKNTAAKTELWQQALKSLFIR